MASSLGLKAVPWGGSLLVLGALGLAVVSASLDTRCKTAEQIV
ncbi:hypothetical protein [Asticcacaulis benevestitus]|nr:hypothetical protein [Asticcacaulis benevestitus]